MAAEKLTSQVSSSQQNLRKLSEKQVLHDSSIHMNLQTNRLAKSSTGLLEEKPFNATRFLFKESQCIGFNFQGHLFQGFGLAM